MGLIEHSPLLFSAHSHIHFISEIYFVRFIVCVLIFAACFAYLMLLSMYLVGLPCYTPPPKKKKKQKKHAVLGGILFSVCPKF